MSIPLDVAMSSIIHGVSHVELARCAGLNTEEVPGDICPNCSEVTERDMISNASPVSWLKVEISGVEISKTLGVSLEFIFSISDVSPGQWLTIDISGVIKG